MIRKILFGTMMLAAMFAAAGSALFFAQPSAAQTVEVQEEAAPEPGVEEPGVEGENDGEREGRRRGRRGFLSGDEKAVIVADTLGITVEELEAAREEDQRISDIAEAQGVDMDDVYTALYNAEIAAVNDAVANEEITQEQADTYLERLELKYLSKIIIDRDVLKAAFAGALGLTVEELEAAKEDGVSMQELLDDAGTTREEVQAVVTAARDEMIDEAVANGEITAEQGEALKEAPVRKGRNGGRGNRGGRGGNGNGGPAFNPADGADA